MAMDLRIGVSLSTSWVTMTSHASSTEMAETPTMLPEHLAENGCLLMEKGFNPEDNPYNLISHRVAMWITRINSMVFITLLFLVGFPGNIISAAVFYKQGLQERINLCVFYLSLADLMVITLTFCLTIEQLCRDFNVQADFFITYLVGLVGFQWVSMFLSAVIASERCFCVVSPLHAQRVLKTGTMHVIIVLVSLTLLAGMVTIAGPKHTVACLFDPDTNATVYIVSFTDYYRENKNVLDVFDVFVYATALPAIFLVVIGVTTAVTVSKLRSALRWRQRSSSSSSCTAINAAINADTPSTASTATSRANSLTPRPSVPSLPEAGRGPRSGLPGDGVTPMLVGTSLLLLLFLTPHLVVQVATFVEEELNYGRRYHNLVTVLWSVISVGRCLNSSLNLFVYLRMGSRFRQTLRQMLGCHTATGSPGSSRLQGRGANLRCPKKDAATTGV